LAIAIHPFADRNPGEDHGRHLSEVSIEFKGKKLLKNKTFRHAGQGPEIEPTRRRDLARQFLMKGWREVQRQ